jgi:pimeloyl-ACP methyl ester carboxylesterase
MTPTFALIHGGQLGAWSFDLLRDELQTSGFPSLAVDLPAGDATAGASRCADVVVEALSSIEGDVILLGHSLGGLTIPLVAERRPIARLVFLCAAYPEPGRSHFQVRSEEPGEAVAPGPSSAWQTPGDFHILPRDLARELFFHDCAPALQEWALDRMRLQSRQPFREITPLQRWPQTPRSFIIATDDRCIPRTSAIKTAQRLFDETPAEIPGGHCVMLSRPRLVADTLIELSRAVS